MIELTDSTLVFRFPEITTKLHARIEAWLEERMQESEALVPRINQYGVQNVVAHLLGSVPPPEIFVTFRRTVRVPDDGRSYPLPPGLGTFPLRHVDDFANAPEQWKRRGGVMFPMLATEALWLQFSGVYPAALKVGAGGRCALSGKPWSTDLTKDPQNYVVLSEQPWLDGFRTDDAKVRQFVAMPLGKQMTTEYQLTGQESWGGLQLQAFPLDPKAMNLGFLNEALTDFLFPKRMRTILECFAKVHSRDDDLYPETSAAMGLAAGGFIRQEILADQSPPSAWSSEDSSRCFVHLCLSEDWKRLTGEEAPPPMPSAKVYQEKGPSSVASIAQPYNQEKPGASGSPGAVPAATPAAPSAPQPPSGPSENALWFQYLTDQKTVKGKTALSNLKSLGNLFKTKTGVDLPGNESFEVTSVIGLRPRKSRKVREF